MKGGDMNKKLIFPAILISAAAIAGGIYATSVDASSTTNSIASKVAEKLGVEESKVSDAMNEARKEEQLDRLSTSLNEAVTDGVITSEQKQKMLDKQSELIAERQKQKDELEQWYTDNGIDQSKLAEYRVNLGMGMGGGGRGFGGGPGDQK